MRTDWNVRDAHGELQIEMVCCESTLLQHIADKKVTRRLVAQAYHFAIQSPENSTRQIDWSKVNAAIIERWSMSALLWIKNQAWSGKCFKEATQ